MSEQKIIEGNKLIAEFIYKDSFYDDGEDCYCESETGMIDFYIENAKYHSSWDWLMRAILKINTMDNFDYSVKIFTMDCQIENSKGEIIARCGCKYNPDELINSVWEAVVEFIKWYNLCQKS